MDRHCFGIPNIKRPAIIVVLDICIYSCQRMEILRLFPWSSGSIILMWY
jgi:hypothetical protein